MDQGLIFIEMKSVSARVAFSVQTIYKMIKEGLFPPQIHAGPKKVAWVASEVREWQLARQGGYSEDQMRALVGRLVAQREPPACGDRGESLEDAQHKTMGKKEQFLTRYEVVKKTTICKTTIHAMVNEGIFPPQARLREDGERVVWSEWEVDEWMRGCLAGWDGDELRALVRWLVANRKKPVFDAQRKNPVSILISLVAKDAAALIQKNFSSSGAMTNQNPPAVTN
jgi:prophage regulatory protein